MGKISIKEFEIVRKIPINFILGKERSGTTLLQTFLENNPSVVAPPESEFILLLYPRFGKIRKWNEKNVLLFINELYKEPWITKIWKIDREFLTSLIMSVKEYVDYASICKLIFYCMRKDKKDILLFIDKNPIYILLIKTINKIFPDAKFINLIRDPRDNISSHLKSFKVNNVRFVALKWLEYSKILVSTERKMPDKFMTLLYEDMVSEPEIYLNKVCQFLSVPYYESMLHNAFPERVKSFSDKKMIMDRVMEVHSNLLKPVNTSNIGKWKMEMNPQNLSIVVRITGNFAKENFNYNIEKHTAKFSTTQEIQILKSRIIFFCWETFTRLKYKNYWFNKFYTKINVYFGRETRVFGKALRES